MYGSEQVFGAPAANIARSADPAPLKTVVRGSDQIARGLVSTEIGLDKSWARIGQEAFLPDSSIESAACDQILPVAEGVCTYVLLHSEQDSHLSLDSHYELSKMYEECPDIANRAIEVCIYSTCLASADACNSDKDRMLACSMLRQCIYSEHVYMGLVILLAGYVSLCTITSTTRWRFFPRELPILEAS